MKINSKVLNMIILFIFVVGLISGCGRELPKEPPIALIIIAGNHANSRQCVGSYEEKIKEAYSVFGNVNVIIADGNPAVVKDENGMALGFCDEEFVADSKQSYKKNYDYWRSNYFLALANKASNAVTENFADDPEVDTLKALRVAVNQLNLLENSMGSGIRKEIIVCDTGLSTTGALSFLDHYNNTLLGSNKRLWEDEEGKAAVQAVVNKLRDNEDIPKLSDVTVTWYGIGAVGGEQEELSNLTIRNLQYIWGEILCAAGAVCDSSTGLDNGYGIFVDINAGDSIECDQKVTKVVFWDNVGEKEGEEVYSNPPIIAPTDTFFIGDTADFREDINPVALLQPWADNIKLYPDLRFLLVGTTADPDRNGGSMKLSLDRANAVKGVLVNELEIEADRLEMIGVGAKAPWYNVNEWQDGKFINDGEAAKSNRAVRILPIDSPLAIGILSMDYN